MTRRTYQQAQTWRAAAVALLAEVGVEVRGLDSGPAGGQQSGLRGTGAQVLEHERGKVTVYLTGSVSIGGPAADADYLCEPLERHGLLNGWHVGSRGSGVVWVPQPECQQPASAPPNIAAALHWLDLQARGWERDGYPQQAEVLRDATGRLLADSKSGRVEP